MTPLSLLTGRTVALFCFLFIFYFFYISVKYRPPRGYGHPPILTRPPTTTTVAPPKTTTTPDLPEQENEGPATTWNSQSFYASTGYSTGYFGGSGGDVEFDDDLTTTWGTTPTPTFKHQTTTPRATTTDATEEPPENENQQQSQTGSNYRGHSGYCFCTPFMYCPRGSIPRGGVCSELSWFSRHRFIRCCYRPSIAKYIHFNYEKRK